MDSNRFYLSKQWGFSIGIPNTVTIYLPVNFAMVPFSVVATEGYGAGGEGTVSIHEAQSNFITFNMQDGVSSIHYFAIGTAA